MARAVAGGTGTRIGVGTALMLLVSTLILLVMAPPALAEGTVTVRIQGQGDASGPGIDCNQTGGPDCSELYFDNIVRECADPDDPRTCFNTREPQTVDLFAGSDRNGFQFGGWTGCDPPPSGRTCTVTVTADKLLTAEFTDVQAPSVSAPTPSSGVRKGTVVLAASASDNAGVIRVEFYNGGTQLGQDTSAPYEFSWNTATTSDGSKSITARAYDAAGHVTTSTPSSFTVDNTPPSTSITSGPTQQTLGPNTTPTNTTQTWSFTVSDATSAVSAECRVRTSAQTPAFGSCSGGSTSHTVSNLPDGNYTFEVRARDGADNVSPIQSRTFRIDTTRPQTTLGTVAGTPGEGAVVDSGSATFSFSSNESGATFECSLDSPTFEPCTSPKTYADLAEGEHTFRVRAVDAGDNRDDTPASRTWTVARAPTVLADSLLPLKGATGVSRTTNVEAAFSEAMRADTLTGKSFKLQRYDAKRKKWRPVPAMLTLTGGGTRVVLDPYGVTEPAGTEKPLPANGKFRVTVSTGLRDAGGTPLAKGVVWTFRTGRT